MALPFLDKGLAKMRGTRSLMHCNIGAKENN
jgi:hypothetical protein